MSYLPNNALNRHTNPYEDLTELGIKQAEELSEKIKNIKFNVIYVSPYLR
ncbi:MAG: phosphoglycerate mutase family protein, partial [Hungatella sp.]